MKIEAAGYMVQDKQRNAIWGVGDTVDDAWAQAVEFYGPIIDLEGNETREDDLYQKLFDVYGATAALIAEVYEKGGNIAWHVIGGVGCTVEEEAAYNDR